MRHRTIASPLIRGIIATLASSVLSTIPIELVELPARLMPSAPPATLWGTSAAILMMSLLSAIGLYGWLMPLCVAIRATLSGRNVRGFKAALLAGVMIAALVVAGFLLYVRINPGVMTPELGHAMQIASTCAAVFALVWMLVFERLSPLRPISQAPSEGATPKRRSLRERIVRTPVETLGIALAAGIVLAGCFIFALLEGDGIDHTEERVGLVLSSPDGSSRAFVVHEIEAGIGGSYATSVFLLPPSGNWSRQNRGLLIWHGERIDSVTVTWTSAGVLRVQPRELGSAGRHRGTSLNAYKREGYEARTDFGDGTSR